MGEALSYNSLGLYLGIALGPPLGELVHTSGRVRLVAWLRRRRRWALVAVVLVAGLTEPPRDPGDDDGHGRLIHRPAIPLSLGFLASLAGGQRLPRVRGAARRREIGARATPALALLVVRAASWWCAGSRSPGCPTGCPSLPLAAGSLVGDRRGPGRDGGAGRRRPGSSVGVVVMSVGRRVRDAGALRRDLRDRPPSERGAAAGTRARVHRPRPRAGPDPARPGRQRPRHPVGVRRRRRRSRSPGPAWVPAARPGASVLGGHQDPERDVDDELRARAAGS